MPRNYFTPSLALSAVAVAALVFLNPRADSQVSPPSQSRAFGQHYCEVSVPLPAAVINEEGAFPGLGSVRFPILDRTVRLTVNFRAQNGVVSFGEVPANCKSSSGECAFQVGAVVQSGYGFPVHSFDVSATGICMGPGPDGTLNIENFVTSPGTLEIGFWY